MPPGERFCNPYSLRASTKAAKRCAPSQQAKGTALTGGTTEENEKRCFSDLSPPLCPLPWRQSKLLAAFRGSSGKSQMGWVCSEGHLSLSLQPRAPHPAPRKVGWGSRGFPGDGRGRTERRVQAEKSGCSVFLDLQAGCKGEGAGDAAGSWGAKGQEENMVGVIYFCPISSWAAA